MSFVSFEAVAGLGFTPYFQQQWLALLEHEPRVIGLAPERVVAEQRGRYQLLGAGAARPAVVSGRLSSQAYAGPHPCVGDFVLADGDTELARIEHVFERASALRRKAVGASTAAQAIAANVDLVIVVSALAAEDAQRRALERALNPRRIERFLRAAREAPARALVVVSKADLRSDADEQAALLRAELGVEALLVSSVTGRGLDQLAACIEPSATAVVVGSSGVGKSSLINHLLGHEAQRVRALREHDARGRHTTTGRELFRLPGGGLLIDTPGMREVGLFADENSDLTATGFRDIDGYAQTCRFRDCRHAGEPGCAVLAAVRLGELPEARVDHARKLQRELAFQQRRHELQARRIEKRSARRTRPQARDEDE